MKLSNTMLISKDLLPSYSKAFTLAEVLITLTILGVVAAITIPSLVNKQSEVAARTKIKKAIANYENAAAVYMAENESDDLDGFSSAYTETFKIVKHSGSGFVTSDGVWWQFSNDNQLTACDSDADTPKICVGMWAYDGKVNDPSSSYQFTPAKGTNNYTAASFMQQYN